MTAVGSGGRVGEPAPPFSLRDGAGERHTLDDAAGHWSLLVFHRHLA